MLPGFCFHTFAAMWLNNSIHWINIVPFLAGWLADRLLGDPHGWHPVVFFGRLIATGETILNQGQYRYAGGMILSVSLTAGIYLATFFFLRWINGFSHYLSFFFIATGVFYSLAGKTLITEVKAVFDALDDSLEKGRKQVSRIVGRDTQHLPEQEVKAAALETLSENLSDGVVAPMFWFAILGIPGMLAYKMVNTLDSMIGYRNERYELFGKTAARMDDIANFMPARLTAWLMLIVSGQWDKRDFVNRYGRAHASPNSGYPEAALAAILNCRFGGTHDYSGKAVEKPYIGDHERPFTKQDLDKSVNVCLHTEIVMGILVTLIICFI